MKLFKLTATVLLMNGGFFLTAQPIAIDKIIAPSEVERIESTLSADGMQGRRTGTPGIDKAAIFISSEMKKAGLQPMPGMKDYFQSFKILKYRQLEAAGSADGIDLDPAMILAFTKQPKLDISEKSGYKLLRIAATDSLRRRMSDILKDSVNTLVLADPIHLTMLKRMKRSDSLGFPSAFSKIILVTKAAEVGSFHLTVTTQVENIILKNVVGYLPGKTKKKEYVIFSSHYDHLGIGKPNAAMDSLYNGANDDASGVTAVLQLGKYFSRVKDNQRNLLFVAFTAEEIGGFGSQYFSRNLDPVSIAAMFNIEMIGTDSKWGKNSAYITGYEKSDFGQILQKNLEGSAFLFYPDPYPAQRLFYRSDNATLARLGVPAHTISTSKMDSEPHYHKPDDEIGTLDMTNMTEIIKSVAISAKTIISGVNTPSRVKE